MHPPPVCDGEGAGEQEASRGEGEETRDTGPDQIRQDPTVNGRKSRRQKRPDCWGKKGFQGGPGYGKPQRFRQENVQFDGYGDQSMDPKRLANFSSGLLRDEETDKSLRLLPGPQRAAALPSTPTATTAVTCSD
ncbi:unnamed protein product [Rangifer tarandus platyrhynchus]|uniref:Uncharacterized protein n=2 Tax=Rangifer tarandus platyrhynchus TaxID=3082113 RepID=A0ACB0DPW8_RANTA|nr:unnamed protein product [Rangifer tarandus platyrhynchus]CAI9690310.1 unnamed protein product [Rangifer tarandus platyrhynchus]